MISRAFAPRAVAICSRAWSTASAASQPNRWEVLAAFPILFGEIRQHCLEHAGVGARGGVVIEVNRLVEPLGASPL